MLRVDVDLERLGSVLAGQRDGPLEERRADPSLAARWCDVELIEHRSDHGGRNTSRTEAASDANIRIHSGPSRTQRYSALIGALSPTLDATFFALSDPKRRGVLERLGGGPATLSQLALGSGLTLNGIKKHVGILELAGLVETEKVGRARECRLGPAMTLGEAGEWIEAHRRAWEGRLDRFERFVERAG